MRDSLAASRTPSTNALEGESSAYLRSAAHQPVNWLPWAPEAFARAKELDRPILLDIGAVWCHWCHVMDGESYENPETAALVNASFVPVKVDRDERPDVDARFQSAVSAITGQGGWPLTAFLTPEGKLFYGGTYFPPEDRYGRPGFPTVLRSVAKFYQEQRSEALRSAEELFEELRGQGGTTPAEELPGRAHLSAAVQTLRRQFDAQHGGFGTAPKFPHPGAIEFLLALHGQGWNPSVEPVIVRTLEGMAEGGVYDHVGGGFHRYSVDARWCVPHFEKMLYDNAELLRAYLHAYAAFSRPLFRETAEGILRFTDEVLADRERGGFGTSQDADVDLHDDGNYFTWTVEEIREVLTPEEAEVVARRFDVDPQGEMQHDPRRNVLWRAKRPGEIAAELKVSEEQINRLLESGLAKLAVARKGRRTPFVDRSLYVNWNAMMASAHLEAAAILDRPELAAFALRTIDRLLAEYYDPQRGMLHAKAGNGRRVGGLLDDQAQMAAALLDAFGWSGRASYLKTALRLAELLLDEWKDAESGGFFDLARWRLKEDGLAPMRAPQKPVHDSPSSSANATLIRVFDRLEALTGDSEFGQAAERTLRAFADLVEGQGLFAGAYHWALALHLQEPPQVVVVGNPGHPETRTLLHEARRGFIPGRTVVTVSDDDREAEQLPPVLRGMVESVHARGVRAVAYLCRGRVCGLPMTSPEEIRRALAAPAPSIPAQPHSSSEMEAV